MFSCSAKVWFAWSTAMVALRGVDRGLLGVERGLLVGDGGLGGLDIGLGLLERDLEIAVVDAGEDLAGLDRLVVADQHGGDIARHLRARWWCCRP